MVNAKDLGERISRMFNFMYEVKGDYYVLGRDYFRPCTDIEIKVYKGFREALEGGNEDWIIDRYRRVRKYVSDCQACSRVREQEIVEFVCRLSKEEIESLSSQADRATRYAQSAYR